MSLIQVLNNFNITRDIEIIINEYIYDLNDIKKNHKIKFQNCLLQINKNWSYVAIFNTGNFCEECYMQSFVNKTTYNEYCDLCHIMHNSIIDNKLINYNEFILSQEIKNFPKWNIICNSNKELANKIFYDNQLHFTDKKSFNGLLYEIKTGPILWTNKQKKYEILILKYGTPIGFDNPEQSIYSS